MPHSISAGNASPATMMAAGPALRVRCWGTRGSLPSPGAETMRYGGNTSCVEITGGPDERVILDAGTGLRPLGEALARDGETGPLDVFLTHFHWDHIQGLPFFRPMYDPAACIRIHGPRQGSEDARALIAGQMAPSYFPVPFERVAARLRFADVEAGPVATRAGLAVSAHRVRHPTTAFAFRVERAGASVAYVPDNELVGGDYDLPADWRASLCAFVSGADVLLHDAMYTDAEYASFAGWGHSSVSEAVRLAEEAGVRCLQLFHHAPGRTDAELTRIVDRTREELARRGSALELAAATEGEELVVEERK